jgi:hypothetical protein
MKDEETGFAFILDPSAFILLFHGCGKLAA